MSRCKNIKMTGSNLKFYMDQKGINISQLAAGIGVSGRSIQRYMYENVVPSVDVCYGISEFLQIDIDRLWTFCADLK